MDFMSKYKDIADPILKEDFNRIIAILRKIIAKGASERLFRTCESKINDRVVAIPLDIRRRKKVVEHYDYIACGYRMKF